jgi:ABC-type uncharacterized transport system ATPase subunit
MRTTASFLRATDIRKSFGPVAALSGASLYVDLGKVTCLLGDNGAGSPRWSRSCPDSFLRTAEKYRWAGSQ